MVGVAIWFSYQQKNGHNNNNKQKEYNFLKNKKIQDVFFFFNINIGQYFDYLYLSFKRKYCFKKKKVRTFLSK